MEALLTGVFSKLESFGQRVAQGALPHETKMPYTAFSQQDAFPQSKDTSGDSTRVTLIRINFWDTDNVRASQELDKTRDFFLNNNIPLDATQCVMDTNLSSEAMFLDPELLENGKEVWHGVLDLLFLTGQ
jgi:hypothetical protein